MNLRPDDLYLKKFTDSDLIKLRESKNEEYSKNLCWRSMLTQDKDQNSSLTLAKIYTLLLQVAKSRKESRISYENHQGLQEQPNLETYFLPNKLREDKQDRYPGPAPPMGI